MGTDALLLLTWIEDRPTIIATTVGIIGTTEEAGAILLRIIQTTTGATTITTATSIHDHHLQTRIGDVVAASAVVLAAAVAAAAVVVTVATVAPLPSPATAVAVAVTPDLVDDLILLPITTMTMTSVTVLLPLLKVEANEVVLHHLAVTRSHSVMPKITTMTMTIIPREKRPSPQLLVAAQAKRML